MPDDDPMEPGRHEPDDYLPPGGGATSPPGGAVPEGTLPAEVPSGDVAPPINPLNDPTADQADSILNPARTPQSGPPGDEGGNAAIGDVPGPAR